MVGAHVTDAWTRLDDRSRTLYMYVVFIAGMAAPLFLFLAGLTIAMAASARAVKVGHAAAAALARKRGLQIFALAFLFRLQSQLLGWGAFTNFLKVDILNVMGIAMTVAAILWSLSANRLVRIALFVIATVAEPTDTRSRTAASHPRTSGDNRHEPATAAIASSTSAASSTRPKPPPAPTTSRMPATGKSDSSQAARTSRRVRPRR